MRQNRWDKQRIQRLSFLLKQNLSYREIGLDMGISGVRACQVAITYGLILPKNPDSKFAKEFLAKGEITKANAARRGVDLAHMDKEENALARRKLDLFRRKKWHARKDGIPFSLSLKDIEWNTYCPILGTRINYFAENIGDFDNGPSFDRVNPKVGYHPKNVRIVSNKGNRLKSDGTIEEHKSIVRYMEECFNPKVTLFRFSHAYFVNKAVTIMETGS